jgi:hypothetical protein
MQVITIESEAFKSLVHKIESIEAKTVTKQQPPEHTWLDNQELCQLLKISTRTAQNYRDNGVLPYTQLGGKVFYRQSDIFRVLEENHSLNASRSTNDRPSGK